MGPMFEGVRPRLGARHRAATELNFIKAQAWMQGVQGPKAIWGKIMKGYRWHRAQVSELGQDTGLAQSSSS
jgi:hypothetical protein